jgi:hypothetical protein
VDGDSDWDAVVLSSYTVLWFENTGDRTLFNAAPFVITNATFGNPYASDFVMMSCA